MSKIIVDEMPEGPWQCPFGYMGEYVPARKGVNSHHCYRCVLDQGAYCNLESEPSCDFLKELPKGGE